MVTKDEIQWVEQDCGGDGMVGGFYGDYSLYLTPKSNLDSPLVAVAVIHRGQTLFNETWPVAEEAITAALDFLNERFRLSDEEREHAAAIAQVRKDTLEHIKATVGIATD